MPNTVTLEEMLAAREARANHQQQLLHQWNRPLVCFVLNVPGPVKTDTRLRRAFLEGLRLLRQSLDGRILYTKEFQAKTGDTAYLVVDLPPEEVKWRTLAIEESTALGRMFDMDVLDIGGQKIERAGYGLRPRRCLLCGRPAAVCGRSRAHTVEELSEAVHQRIADHFCQRDAERIGGLAARALLYEVCVTPKPGLVDRADSGAHQDMDIYTFQRSVAALQPWLTRFARAGLDSPDDCDRLFSLLRELGLEAETAMYQVTGGVNTHKGAVFSFSLLCGATGRCLALGKKPGPETVLDGVRQLCACGSFARQIGWPGETAGAALYQVGIGGLRLEAAFGFPTAAEHGLPRLEALLAGGASNDTAGSVALLNILAHAQDTCFMKRSSPDRLREVQETLTNLSECADEGLDWACNLNREFIQDNISPGGCADLLAICWFLHFCRTDLEMSS